WHGLKKHADEAGLAFISSPFSDEAVELLQRVGVAAWKVASGEVNNHLMIGKMCQGGEPVILSSGMSDLDEIADTINFIKSKNVPVCILQCTTSYPTKAEQVGINMLPVFAEQFGTAVGLSDHSATIFPGLIATWQGAQVLEVHLTLTRRAFGPDVIASLTVEEMTELVRGVRYVEKMRANPHKKTSVSDDVIGMRAIFMKSLVAAKDLKAGEKLTIGDLTARKPGDGISVRRHDEFIGRVLAKDVAAHTPLSEDDVL
ncbi:MAG TPA: N-acetylneuraminate synthase, partial [Rhizobiales bacterium]|nr:N-acetylneuraminate synthase [Hyphomicrobiales bacterium]